LASLSARRTCLRGCRRSLRQWAKTISEDFFLLPSVTENESFVHRQAFMVLQRLDVEKKKLCATACDCPAVLLDFKDYSMKARKRRMKSIA
jgi:hypothetical protein